MAFRVRFSWAASHSRPDADDAGPDLRAASSLIRQRETAVAAAGKTTAHRSSTAGAGAGRRTHAGGSSRVIVAIDRSCNPAVRLPTIAIAILGTSFASASYAAPPGPGQTAPVVPVVTPRDRAYPGEIRLEVDASDVQRRVVHVTEHVSGIGPGTVLLFPKWLPGNHSATGPIGRFAGLKISANGAPVSWARDVVDMYAFHVHVPAGVSAIDVAFDYLSPTSSEIDPLEMSRDLMVLDWNNVLLYPAGYFVRRIPVVASLRVPEGWQLGTALEAGSSGTAGTVFNKTNVETLIDSPVFAGRYYQRLDLDPGGKVPVTMNLFADRPELLVVKPGQLEAHRALVQQAYRLFGIAPLCALRLPVIPERPGCRKRPGAPSVERGRRRAKTFTDWDKTAVERDLLPHEYTHSWNGKFRRPADLWTPNYNVPMRDSLLWVYEGQTRVLGRGAGGPFRSVDPAAGARRSCARGRRRTQMLPGAAVAVAAGYDQRPDHQSTLAPGHGATGSGTRTITTRATHLARRRYLDTRALQWHSAHWMTSPEPSLASMTAARRSSPIRSMTS